MKPYVAALAGLAFATTFCMVPVAAQTDNAYPEKPIRIIVTFPPGGSADSVLRTVAPGLSEKLGQQVLIENRPGAGGNIGLTTVVQSEPDGYVLGVGAAGALAANKSLYSQMPFDPIEDLAPISLIAHIPFVLVANPNAPVKSIEDLLKAAGPSGQSFMVGHGGNGTAMHLSVELLKQMAQLNLEGVAYKGNGPAAVDVMGGQVPLAMIDMPSALQNVQAGRMRALAVTGARRQATLPDVPTLAEAGVPGYESTGWFGFVAPAGTSPAIIERLQNVMNEVLQDPDVVNRAEAMGVNPAPTSASEFAQFIKDETDKWAKVIEISQTRLD